MKDLLKFLLGIFFGFLVWYLSDLFGVDNTRAWLFTIMGLVRGCLVYLTLP